MVFFANGNEVAADSSSPFNVDWIPNEFGNYVLYAKAIDNNGETSKSESINIAVGVSEQTSNMIDSDNDAEMYNHNGAMYLDSEVLDLVEENHPQKVGLRFPAVPLPKEARLIEAKLIFTAAESNTGQTTFNIRTQTSANPASFSSNLLDLLTRPLSSATVYWQATDWVKGNVYESPNIASAVRAVQNLSGWSEDLPMVFIIGGSGNRKAFSFDGSPNQSPRLYLKYDYGNDAAPDLGSAKEICQGDTVVLLAGSHFNTYEWNGDANLNDSILTVSNNSYNYVWVRSGTNNHVVGFDSVTVRVNSKPILSLQDTSVCESVVPIIKVSGAYDSYEWSTGSIDSQAVLNQAGLYYLTVNDGTCEVVDSFEMDFLPPYANPLPADTLVADSVLHLDITALQFMDYEWSNGDVGPSTVIDSPGTYSVLVTNIRFCTQEFFIEVDFKEITADTSINTSIQSVSQNKWEIYPNPTEQFINVRCIDCDFLEEISLYDLKGKKMKSFKSTSERNIRVNLNFLKTGVYFVGLVSENGAHQTKRILKL